MRKAILDKLIENQNEFISGELLSEELGVTRAAVWKCIKQLKAEGVEIESVSRKGYKLLKEVDTLETISFEIKRKEIKIFNKLHYFKEIDSTNDYAKKIANSGAGEGEVVIAEEQIGGRGRLGRSWSSPKETGIWMSIVLRPDIAPLQAPLMTQLVAVIVAKAIEKTCDCQVGIKWPNDIVVNHKKVCGILTEMSGEMNQVNYIIVGIGINVNQEPESFPADIKEKATSLKAYLGRKISRKNLVINILEAFDQYYLGEQKQSEIMEMCKDYSVTLGEMVRVIYRNEEIKGKAIDLTEDGELLVEKEDGQVIKVSSGEVSVRGLYGYI